MTEGVEEALKRWDPGFLALKLTRQSSDRRRSGGLARTTSRPRCFLASCSSCSSLARFFEWRVAFISLITIPLSLMGAALVLYWRGESINTMVLAGLVIALGAIVDDAIIDVENILRRLRENRRSETPSTTAHVILEASLEVRGPIVYATLIIVAAAAPVLFLEGLSGAFFKPLVFSYALAVVASLVIALTVTPALS